MYFQGDGLEPGEVTAHRALSAAAANNPFLKQSLHMSGLTSLTAGPTAASEASALGAQQPPVGRAPLRHRRTIGELYGLMNNTTVERSPRRGRGGPGSNVGMKYRRDCPIPGCGARYLTNLCDHLKKTHGLGPEERRPWLEKAKRMHQQKQLQEQQQQHIQQQTQSAASKSSPTNPQSLQSTPNSISSSSTNPTANQLAASPALAAIALATSQSTANLSSTDSIAMAMSQIPLNSAALLMQQAQALSLLNAQAFPTPQSFPGFTTAAQQRAAAAHAFPNLSALSGTRVRSPWNSSGSRKNCPVPGCGAKSLLNLSDHLSKVHSMTRDERQPWLQRARDETP